MLNTDISSNLQTMFNSARSTGSYDTLYAISKDHLVQRSLIQYFSSESSKIVELVDLLYDTLELFGYDRGQSEIQKHRHWSGYNKLMWSFNCYVWIYGRDSWVELFKWKTSSFFAHIFNACNIPKKPRDCIIYNNPHKLFFGRAQRYLLKQNREWLRSFANTVLMLKKGAPAVSDEMVLDKRIEVYNQLTTKPTPSLVEGSHVVAPKRGTNMKTIRRELGIEEFGWEKVPFEQIVIEPLEVHTDYSEQRLKHFITKVIEECFEGRRLTEKCVDHYTFPSLSANYNNSRKRGGGLGEIVYQINKLRNKIFDEFLTDDFHGYDFFDSTLTYFLYDLDPNHLNLFLKPQRAFYGSEFPFVNEGLCFEFDDEILSKVYSFVFRELCEVAKAEEPKTATVGLPEPLKVRVITKGPPTTYFVLKRIQKFLWKTLKNHPTFQLIGTPLTEEIVNKFFPNPEWILSGDYKASTDNIYSWISNFACDEVFRVLNTNSPILTDLHALTKRGLTGHWISNPKYQHLLSTIPLRDLNPWFKDKGTLGKIPWAHSPLAIFNIRMNNKKIQKISLEEIEKQKALAKLEFKRLMKEKGIERGSMQEQGQLMGSVVSFPFLCIINAAVCWWSLSCDNPLNEFKKLEDLELLVNGDDCVFNGSKDLEAFWLECIQYVGFTSSVGKTYFSYKDLLVMNSMTFFYKDKWTLQKYINFGLIKARNKSGEDQRNCFAYASIQKDLLSKTPASHLDNVNKMFFRNHMQKFKNTGLPFYMPQWSGGLGLIPPANHNTYHDRLILTSRIKTGESFEAPPKADEWLIDKKMRSMIEILPIAETYESSMFVNNKIYNLEEKEYYSPFLSLILLTTKQLEKTLYFEQEDVIYWKKHQKYCEKMKKRWELPPIQCRVRSLPELTDRFEPKKHISIILSR